MLREVNVGAVSAADLPALETAAREVKDTAERILIAIRAARESL